MPVRIVDASALGALLFGEPRAQEIAQVLGQAPPVAPALLPFELASICLKKIATYPDQADAILDAFGLFRQMSVDIVDVDHTQVILLARETGLTTYDASYLWLTRALAGELISLDEVLLTAWRAFRI